MSINLNISLIDEEGCLAMFFKLAKSFKNNAREASHCNLYDVRRGYKVKMLTLPLSVNEHTFKNIPFQPLFYSIRGRISY